MARTGRRFPSHVLIGQRQGLAVPSGVVVTPRPNPLVVQAPTLRPQASRRASVIQNRWPGYQWVGLPPINPAPKQFVVDDAVWTAAAQQNRARSTNIYQPRTVGDQVVVTPTPSKVVGQAEQAAVRRYRHGSVTQNRWPGYEWVGLPPVTPLTKQVVVDAAVPVAATRRAHHGSVVQNRWSGYEWVGLPPVLPSPKQVVQAQAAVWTSRLDRRRGLVIEPAVQAAAAAAGAVAPTVTPPRSLVVQARLPQTARRRRGLVIEPGVQLAASAPAAPVVTPLPRQIVVLARATPRQARSGHVVSLRAITAPVAPPRTVTVTDLCPATTRRTSRGGHVIVGRPVVSPTGPPRPLVVRQAAAVRRPRRGGVVAPGVQCRPTGPPPPSTLITTPATGYVRVGDTSTATLEGDTGYPAGSFQGVLCTSPLLKTSLTLMTGVGEPVFFGAKTATPSTGSTGLVRV